MLTFLCEVIYKYRNDHSNATVPSMFDQASPLAIAAATMATNYVTQAFILPAQSHAADVGPPEVPRQFPAADFIQHPLRLAPILEGLTIERAFGLALKHDDHFLWLGKSTFVVTEADRALAERNIHADLGAIEPPAASEPIGSAEFDGVAVDRRNGVLLLCDIRRSSSRDDRDVARFRQACLAARRASRREGLRFAEVRTLQVRWFPQDRGIPPGFVTRDSVNEALNATVREVVDYAVSTFRAGFAARLKAILTPGAFDPDPVARNVTAQPVGPNPVHVFDPAALRRAFGRKVRLGRIV